MRRNLTDRVVAAVRPPQTGRIEVGDEQVRGLILRVAATGKRSWALRYRDQRKRQHRLTLGNYPDVTLSKARQKALEALAANADGVDLRASGQEAAIVIWRFGGRISGTTRGCVAT